MSDSEALAPAEHEEVQEQPAPQLTLWRMITGGQIAQAIHVAARLGIADQLIEGPLPAAVLAQRCGAHAPTLYRLLRALASLGIFWEDREQRFHLTKTSQFLRTDVPYSLHALILLCNRPTHERSWSNLLWSVQEGENAFAHLYGQGYWDYLSEHEEEQKICHKALSSLSAGEVEAIFSAYDFSSSACIVDIAGGWGKLLGLILQSHPQAKGVLFDLPSVIEKAREQLVEMHIADRCEALSGDMFDGVPEGGDLYMVKSVIHDWEDDQVRILLRNIANVMKPGARLLLIEQVLAARNVPDIGKFMDLFLLTVIGGQERTEQQFRQLVEEAGLIFERVIPTQSAMSILECRKPAS